MYWIITNNSETVYGPVPWNSYELSRELRKLGPNVSLPQLPVEGVLQWGDIGLSSVPDPEPEPEPEPVDPQTLKSLKLKQAENRYILFCRSVGLPDLASSTDFEELTADMQEQGLIVEAITLAVQALALINDVTQNEGKWADIAWHPEIVE